MSGQRGGSHGNLYLEISFAEHPLFQAKKRNIHMNLPITPWEAALGGKIECPTLASSVHLNIPPNSQSGEKLRLKGRGLSSASHSGDQIVTLKIVIPSAKTRRLALIRLPRKNMGQTWKRT